MSSSTEASPGVDTGNGAHSRRGRRFNWRMTLTILAFTSPAIIFVAWFTYYPMIRGSQMAFRRWSLWDLTDTPFIGLGNFVTLINDPIFAKTMLNSVVWVVGSLVPQFLIGFLIALGLRKAFRFRGLYQALIFYPWAVSGFLIGILFRWMFNSEFGVFNDMLMRSGLTDSPIPWLANPDLALVAVIVANIWYGVTFFAIMILAALQSVPEEMLEAAAIDGAGRYRTLFPLYWIALTSFKPASQIAEYPVRYWPREFTLDNYLGLFSAARFGQNMLNSLVVATSAALVATFIALLSGYVLSRFTFKGRGALMGAFLVTQMIPAFIALGPLYQMFSSLGLVNTRFGLSLVYIAMTIPFASIMLRGFFDNIPDSLEEAAMVDGLTRFGALWRITVPVMAPGIIATFIFNFVNTWNELFLSVTLITSGDKRTIPAALNGFITSFNIEWGPLSAAAVLTIIPTMVLFAFASRWIIAGLTQGATKG